MKRSDAPADLKTKTSRAAFFGYLLFGSTVLACTAWMIFQYYQVKGWNLWEGDQIDHPAMIVIRRYIPITSTIVALVAGYVGKDKKTKASLFTACYLYTFLIGNTVPTVWHTEWDYIGIGRMLSSALRWSALFSIYIIPSFAVSSFASWSVRAVKRLIETNRLHGGRKDENEENKK